MIKDVPAPLSNKKISIRVHSNNEYGTIHRCPFSLKGKFMSCSDECPVRRYSKDNLKKHNVEHHNISCIFSFESFIRYTEEVPYEDSGNWSSCGIILWYYNHKDKKQNLLKAIEEL